MIWNLISWILFGAVAGAVAKWLRPGRQSGGFWFTSLIGIVGAILGGWLGSILLDTDAEKWTWSGFILSVIGALIVLAIYSAITKKR